MRAWWKGPLPVQASCRGGVSLPHGNARYTVKSLNMLLFRGRTSHSREKEKIIIKKITKTSTVSREVSQGLHRPQACGLVARRPRLGLRQRHGPGPAPAPLPAPPPGTAAGGSPGPGAVQGLLPGLLPLPPAVAELQLGLPGWGAPGHPPLGLLHPVSTMGQGWKRCSPTSRSDPSIGPFLVFYPR